MKKHTFTKGDLVKECHLNEGVRELLIADGWVEKKEPKKRAEKKKD